MQFISLLGLVWNTGLLIQGLFALHKLQGLRSGTSVKSNNIIRIIIPIRNEKIDHLQQCIEYFLAQKNISKITICLTEIGGDHKKYIEPLNELVEKDDRLSYTTYKGDNGYKAEQINVALKQIVNSEGDSLVGIYDIDSRPDRKVFEYVAKNKIDIGQQPILYDANFNDLSLLAAAGSLHQTSWVYGFEMFNLLFPKSRLVYTVGHGLYLSTNTLKVCGLFEEKCMTEDLMYGYKASIAKMNFQVIPYYEHAKFVKKLSGFVPQSARWYRGELELIDRLPVWFNKFNGDVSDKKKYFFRFIELMWWPLERIVYVVTLIGVSLSLISLQIALSYTMVLVLSGYISAIIVAKNSRWSPRLMLAPILIPLWHAISVMGPLIAIIKRITGSQMNWTVTKK